MLDVRLARLALPLPLEPAIRRALTQRDPAAQHEGLVLAWELAARILAGSLWSVCRHLGATSDALERVSAKLERPSLGHWVELARTCSTLLRKRNEPAALAFRATLDGLDQALAAEGELGALADRIALLPDAPKRPRRVQELLDQIPFYRNSAQSTHKETGQSFRAESVTALLHGLVDFCERVPLCGEFVLVLVGRLEAGRDLGTAELARLAGTSLSWSVRTLPASALRTLHSWRPYLFTEPELAVPLFPMAAVTQSGADWHVGWYARHVHVPTVAYQGAGGGDFQIALEPAEFASLVGAGGAERETTASAEALKLDPYRGLLAYDEEHASIFYGREEETEEALARIEDRGALFVFGASGSGKSSWIRAGIVPALRVRASAAGRTLVPIALVPGDRPIAALRRALLGARAGTAKQELVWARTVDDALPETVASIDERALARLLRTLAKEDAQPVLVVDQLEEATALAADPAESRIFLALLARAAQNARGIGAVVLASARTDLLAPLLDHEPLRRVFQLHGAPVGSIPPDRLARVVLGPLRGRRVPVEPGLPEAMLADVGDEPGALALLSQVLTTVWNERSRFGGGLTRAGYEDAGRVEGALRTQAEAALAEARAAHADAEKRVDRLFRALATNDKDKRFSRRRVKLASLASELDVAAEDLRAVAQPFVARRLVVLSGQAGQETVEVAHERLFDAWPRLAALLAAQRDVLDVRRDIVIASVAWESSGRRTELWSDATSKLRRGEEMLASGMLDLDARGKAFLAASRESVRRRTRIEHGALAVMAGLLIGTGYLAWELNSVKTAAVAEKEEVKRLNIDLERTTRDAKWNEQRAVHAESAARSQVKVLRLNELLASLWPASAENLESLRQWIRDSTAVIQDVGQSLTPSEDFLPPDRSSAERILARLLQRPRLAKLEPYQLSRLERQGITPSDGTWFTNYEEGWQYEQLHRLVSGLYAFDRPTDDDLWSMDDRMQGWGALRRERSIVAARRASLEGEAEGRWVSERDGIARRYGFDLEPQFGLVPIGQNAHGLWEFAHVQSGEPPPPDGKPRAETGIVFVLVPAAKHGAGNGSIAEPFFISKYELSQAQWERLSGFNPSAYGPHYSDPEWNKNGAEMTSLHPVESVKWGECYDVLGRFHLALPTVAQWEFAASGGERVDWKSVKAREHLNGTENVFDRFASGGPSDTAAPWEDSFRLHAPISTFAPSNAYGLHDVHGNVSEWCADGIEGAPERAAFCGRSYRTRWDAEQSILLTEQRRRDSPSNEVGVRPVRPVIRSH